MGPTDFLARQEGGHQTQGAASSGWNQVVSDSLISRAGFSLQRLGGWDGWCETRREGGARILNPESQWQQACPPSCSRRGWGWGGWPLLSVATVLSLLACPQQGPPNHMFEGAGGMKANTRLVQGLTCAEGNNVAATRGGMKLQGRKVGIAKPAPAPYTPAVASGTSVLPAHVLMPCLIPSSPASTRLPTGPGQPETGCGVGGSVLFYSPPAGWDLPSTLF